MGKRMAAICILMMSISTLMGCLSLKSDSVNIINQNETKKQKSPIYNDDGSVTLPEGYMSNGFYEIGTKKIIDGRSTIKIPDNTISGRITFRQNFNEEKSYLLIVLVDYMQHEFYVENQSYQSYLFKLEGKDEFNLNISVELSDSEGSEFAYIIVDNPEEKKYLINGEYDWEKMFSSRTITIKRFNVERDSCFPEENVNSQTEYEEFQAEGNVNGFELVKKRDDLTAFVEGKSGETVELVLLNQANNSAEKSYVLMGFADWEQIPINGENIKSYVTIPSGTSFAIPVTLPDVKEPTIFQIIAFANPNTVLDNKNLEEDPTTFRVLVTP